MCLGGRKDWRRGAGQGGRGEEREPRGRREELGRDAGGGRRGRHEVEGRGRGEGTKGGEGRRWKERCGGEGDAVRWEGAREGRYHMREPRVKVKRQERGLRSE